jgi:hypothetical protein
LQAATGSEGVADASLQDRRPNASARGTGSEVLGFSQGSDDFQSQPPWENSSGTGGNHLVAEQAATCALEPATQSVQPPSMTAKVQPGTYLYRDTICRKFL